MTWALKHLKDVEGNLSIRISREPMKDYSR